jgi:Flp pilus assembly protein TadG
MFRENEAMSSSEALHSNNSSRRRFCSSQDGSVAIIFALAFIPVLGISGAAVDYASATQTRARMTQAADAAVLATANQTNLSGDARSLYARRYFEANLAGLPVSDLAVRIKDVGPALRIEADAKMTTNFMAFLGIDKMQLAVAAEVVRGGDNVEVALVMDTTYSMVNDLAGAKVAAKDFINMLQPNTGNGGLRLSVVPYIASVNPGRTNLGMSSMDVFAESSRHGVYFEGAMVGRGNCIHGGGTGTSKDPGSGGNGAWLQDKLRKLANVGRELFGVSPAAALGETPKVTPPLQGTIYNIPAAKAAAPGAKFLVPTGFIRRGDCEIINPKKINVFDLYDRIPNAQWRGCVEARPVPFDVTDDAPTSANAETLFIPYFWPDEEGTISPTISSPYAVNNYMNDLSAPYGLTYNWPGTTGSGFAANIFKYNGVNPALLTEELGPNKACPDELMRLSGDKSALLAKIDSLKVRQGGGTINSEGVAWGWRTLSPKAPFADGKAYGSAKKFIVLLSDGENEIGDLSGKKRPNGAIPFPLSHYNAYGYLQEGPFPAETFVSAHSFLDERFRLVCQNAKAAGVQIISILFRENTARARNLMKSCASNDSFFYQAADTASLTKAFQRIATDIGKLRISK